MHAVPTATELLEAVREFLESDVRDATTGRVAFLARVAANTLTLVERELRLGAEADITHQRNLARAGFDDDVQFVRAIRAGELDGREADVVGILREWTTARARIANPRWLAPEDR